MPPATRYSRDLFCDAVPDENGLVYLTEREPFAYVDRDDNIEHVAGQGDTWTSLAVQYFSMQAEPDSLWWVIADFQPGGGIVDPTIRISPGTRIYVPSQRTLEEEILSENRRAETKA